MGIDLDEWLSPFIPLEINSGMGGSDTQDSYSTISKAVLAQMTHKCVGGTSINIRTLKITGPGKISSPSKNH